MQPKRGKAFGLVRPPRLRCVATARQSVAAVAVGLTDRNCNQVRAPRREIAQYDQAAYLGHYAMAFHA